MCHECKWSQEFPQCQECRECPMNPEKPVVLESADTQMICSVGSVCGIPMSWLVCMSTLISLITSLSGPEYLIVQLHVPQCPPWPGPAPSSHWLARRSRDPPARPMAGERRRAQPPPCTLQAEREPWSPPCYWSLTSHWLVAKLLS